MPRSSIARLLICIACCLFSGELYATDKQTGDSITMQAINYQQWLLQRKTYRGRILVVDMWATWCTSCIERFPKMVALDKKYANRDVRIVSINLDDREDAEAIASANRFLHNVRANFPNYRMDENLMQAFEKLQLIGIPAVVIYDREGQQRYRLTGDNPYRQFTDRDVDTAIQQLLDE